MVNASLAEFRRYDSFIRKSLSQLDEDALNRLPVEDGNSIAMLIRHLSGNIKSRFTDFLTSDGEKEWRHRDREFDIQAYSRSEVTEMWDQAWHLLESTLQDLNEDDLNRTVTIRGQELTVQSALLRALAHLSYLAGQIVLLARMDRASEWDWITILRGASNSYNSDPTMEKGFK